MDYYVIDAFADGLFKGNPAGVCVVRSPVSDCLMQNIAFENNLAETAFLSERKGGYNLRWFTPETEMDLCGHATLASAFVVMNYIETSINEVVFETRSGTLAVRRDGNVFTMDFPSRKPVPVDIPPGLEKALGCRMLQTQLSRDLLAVVESADIVSGLRPDIDMLRQISSELAFGIIVTARGSDCDFVSRFFAPNAGITEDPVTGSSHSTLIPFWSELLSKNVMIARQLSRRGGTIFCENRGERVRIGGTAVCYLKGELYI